MTRRIFSTLLPICVILMATVSLHGQVNLEDPFGSLGSQPAPADSGSASPFGLRTQTDSPNAKESPTNPKVQKFEEQMNLLTEQYSKMIRNEAALLEMVDRLQRDLDLKKLEKAAGPGDATVKETFLAYKAKFRALSNQLREVELRNAALIKRVNTLEESAAKDKAAAKKALTNRNEMHQVLFASLLNSDDAAQQELALVHLFSCIDKYGRENPVTIYTPDLLRRISELTDSKSATVKGLASRCLFTTKPDTAIELGIQFGPDWKPLEYAKASVNTHRIFSAMDEEAWFDFEETPIREITEEIQQKYNLPIRFESAVDTDLAITFKTSGVPLGLSLAGLLEKYKLGFAIIDDQIVVMKDSNPKLMVTRTYNVRGLAGKKLDLEKVVTMVKQSLGQSNVGLTSLSEHIFIATASESDQIRIGKRLAKITPSPKWYSR
ncbi:MAG: hypothetical protein AB8B55_00760 [Mariniblastus sp.]